MNIRRTARGHSDVRLCEANGTISTAGSRAAARLDRARTQAFSYSVGIR